MKKVTLYRSESPDIKISMELYFTEKGQLYFDGYDIGKTVEEYWGDSDYEYIYTIEPEEVLKLYAIFGISEGDQSGLLMAIKDHYGGNDAYSRFGEFLSANDIKYAGFTWN